MPGGDFLGEVKPGEGLTESEHTLQLPHCDPPGTLSRAAGISLAEMFVLLHQQLLGVVAQLRLEHPGEVEVPGEWGECCQVYSLKLLSYVVISSTV